jgi:uncharacterized protein
LDGRQRQQQGKGRDRERYCTVRRIPFRGPLIFCVDQERNPAAPARAGLVLSQVYGGGGNSGSTYKNDFIELLNASDTTVNLIGMSVQYTSGTGGTWSVTNLTFVTLQSGQYYLIQEAEGAGGTTNLPTPDAIGTISMSATAGKVALVNNTVDLIGSSPPTSNILDLVGYGNATFFEGTGPAPAPSNTESIVRLGGGLTDTRPANRS